MPTEPTNPVPGQSATETFLPGTEHEVKPVNILDGVQNTWTKFLYVINAALLFGIATAFLIAGLALIFNKQARDIVPAPISKAFKAAS